VATAYPSAASSAPPGARWIYRPSLDLIVGCGAWSAPLLLLAGRSASATRTWAVTFYLLALAFNYPHFMATVYRAYHTRTEFAKYRLFTLHITALLAIVGIASHVWAALVPWIFSLYITWSPWHYTGQNFGLAMMFARRNGVAPTDQERRRLYVAFLASYALLFISFHTGPSSDPLIRSLGIPESIATPARVLLVIIIGVLGTATMGGLIARAGLRAMLAPLTLAATQTIWFVVPALAGWIVGAQPPTRYSSGVLAVMHSAQYLWITSYYARREAEAAAGGAWRPWAYAATLVAGGIALFVPGPWIASYLFHADFTRSLLIFTAIVNIHHFILDGAIWKLRDGRIAALLVDSHRRAREAGLAVHQGTRWLVGDTRPARAVRVAALLMLAGWAAVDQARFILGTSDTDLAALARAAALNPYDSSVQRRKARLLIEQQRYEEAYAEYEAYIPVHPEDGEALLNMGVLATQFGRQDEALRRWEAALNTDSGRVNARRYLAQLWANRADALEQVGRTSDAAHAFQRALALDEQGGDFATLGVDWFNYGQFLRRQRAEPQLVLACLLQAEDLLARKPDERTATVREVRATFEREQPDAAAAVRRSLAATLAAARARY
jgi:tetratricopeptide (TPR) repeat protein